MSSPISYIHGDRPKVTLTSEKLVIENLVITDPSVISAIHDWGINHPQGPEVALAELPDHIARLLALGARVSELALGSASAELMSTAARNATESVTASADRVRAELAAATEMFTDQVARRLEELLHGENSAVSDVLRSTLAAESRALTDGLASRIDTAVTASVSAGVNGAMSRIADGITAVGSVVGEVKDKLTADTAARDATAAVVDKSAVLKGAGFEDAICDVLEGLAGECSAEFEPTGHLPGVAGHGSGDSLKGDGVWHTGGHTLVIETHNSAVRSGHSDGHKDGWSRYLAAAMKNRGAGAALGIVCSADQNKGQLFRDFGSTMAVVVCDPSVPEDVMRLKFVVQVMALVARQQGGGARAVSVDLSVARRAVADMAEKVASLTEIEKLALKTSKSASELHDRVTLLKVAMVAPLDRARETLEAATNGMKGTEDVKTSREEQ